MDDKMIRWENKPFIKDHVATFFFMPLNFGQVMRRLDRKVRAAGATMPDYLCLSDHTSKWKMDLYLAVDKEVPGAENTTLSGNYYSRVYEGSFQETGKWCKDFEAKAGEKRTEGEKAEYVVYYLSQVCEEIREELCGDHRRGGTLGL